MAKDAAALYQEVGAQLVNEFRAEMGQMMGMPALKFQGKMFGGFYKDAMTFKLGGDSHAEALALKGAHLFDPSGMGRAMKEWVVVPLAHSKRWPELGHKALEYVATQPKKK